MNAPSRPRARRKLLPARLRAGSQSGFGIVEVLISSLLVGIIAIATFAAFDSAGRATADQRAHAQATVLAQQDQERLRAMTATELVPQFTGTTKTEAVNGTVFTIGSSARYVSATNEALTCGTTSGGNADYLQTTSSVTWPALAAGKRPPVTQSSIVTNPPGSSLLVTVKNQNNEPVEGATVTVYGVTSKTTTSQTTPASGCVLFAALAASDTTVEVGATKGTWVDTQGKVAPAKKVVTLSQTTVTTQPFTIAEPGSIQATFESNKVTVGITGATFFAYQSGIKAPSDFVGGVAGGQASVTLAGLFPFAKQITPFLPEPYVVYAGDCEANNPETVTAKAVPYQKVAVTPNGVTPVTVDAPAVTVTIDENTQKQVVTEKKAATLVTTAQAPTAKIINSECSSATAQNVTVAFEHTVPLITGKLDPKYKYQPYAKKLEFCVVAKIGASWYKAKLPFENKVVAGTTLATFYMKSLPAESVTTTYSGKSAVELKC